MSLIRPQSLRWRLVSRLTIAQAAILAIILFSMSFVVSLLWYYGYIGDGANEATTAETVTKAVRRSADGGLTIETTAEMDSLRRDITGMWFLVQDAEGHRVEEGVIPQEVLAAVPLLDTIAYADLLQDPLKDNRPVANIQWAETSAGWVKIMSGTQGQVTFSRILASNQPAVAFLIILTSIMAFATAAVTPFVVRHAFKGLDLAAEETKKIDIDRSGTRLSTRNVPLEIVPFVTAVNDALARLDKGYESHRRFLTDAAHELRTPIAILTTRLSGLEPGPLKTRLLEDSDRLTALTGQLLDLQRLEQQNVEFVELDLVALAERVVLDMAPIAFKAGYEMIFEPDADRVVVNGDQTAVERALTNLVQNAINYGGRQGAITLRISPQRWIEVCDEGRGIPEAELEQIFEAFHRLKQDGRGVGLGLDLVQKIMRLHGGNAMAISRRGRGACFRLIFPPPDQQGPTS